jgi:hypothetical protein
MKNVKPPGIKLATETLCILESNGARGFPAQFITCPSEIPPCHPLDEATQPGEGLRQGAE